MKKSQEELIESIRSLSSSSKSSKLQAPSPISSLYYQPESFIDFCNNFLKENNLIGTSYDDIFNIISFFSKFDESSDIKTLHISKFINWIKTLESNIPNLEKLVFKIFYIKLLGIILIFKLVLNYSEFEEIIEFFSKSLKFQKFLELKQEFSDIIYIFLQNFHLISENDITKTTKSSYLAELFLIKCLKFFILNHFDDFSHDFTPIFLKSLCLINENICKDLILKEHKKFEELFLKRQIILKIYTKTIKLFNYFLFQNEETAEKSRENAEIFETIFNSIIYYVLLENPTFMKTNYYRKFSEIIQLQELFSLDCNNIEQNISYNLLKKELLLFSQNKKNELSEIEDLKFLKTIEIIFQAIIK